MSLTSIADAATACGRLQCVFDAETLDETLVINDNMDVAVRAEGVSFTWDSPPPLPEDPKKKDKGGKMDMKMDKRKRAETPIPPPADDANIFKVTDIDLEIPRGQLVAVVGAVGMGKTSLLQGLIGEMRKTAGKVEFGGTVGYCAQNAWIQVGSLIIIISPWPLITDGTNRIRPFGITSVSDDHLTRRDTGRLSETRV